MDVILTILAFVFVLGLIIAVHEGGHFLFAKRAKILVREFAFGMGPQILKKKKGETVYSLRAFPIGGFCAIAGEEYEADPFTKISRVKLHIENGIIKGFYLDVENDEIKYPEYEFTEYDIYDKEKTGNLYMDVVDNGNVVRYPVDPQAVIYYRKMEMQIAPYERTLGAKTKGQRAMVMVGGPLMNFLLAVIVFFIAGLIQGFPNYDATKISFAGMDEEKPTPAYVAGMRSGDVIIELRCGDLFVEPQNWSEISAFMDEYTQMGETRPIEVKYLRAGVEETATINPTVMMYNIYVSGKFTAQGIEIVDLDERDTKGMADIEALAVGDVITEINGVSYLSLPAMYRELTEFSGIDPNEKITMKVIRGGEIKEIQVRPLSKAIMERIAAGEPIVDVNMGINPSYKFNLVKSLAYSGKQTVRSVTAIYDSFYLLFKDKSVTVKAFSGPVGIAVIIGSVVRQGFVSILVLMGLLSVNVGLFNLLPIPALDGGRLVFLGYEAITGKKPNQKVETALITITMLLLIGFMIFVTFNDIIGQF